MTVMHDGGGVATNRLSREAAMRTAQSLHDSLGNADRARLDAMLPLLAQDGRIRLSDAVTRLFPDTPRKDALTAFRQFRERLRSAVGSTLILEVDTATRTDPSNRWCWFAGDDAAANVTAKVESEKARAWEAAEVARIPDAAAKFVDAETRSVVRKPQDAIAVTVESVSKRPISRIRLVRARRCQVEGRLAETPAPAAQLRQARALRVLGRWRHHRRQQVERRHPVEHRELRSRPAAG